MDDMPKEVAVLQERLRVARNEFRKLMYDRVEFERRALVAEATVRHTLSILNCDDSQQTLRPHDVYYPPPDHPLFVAAIDAVTSGNAGVRARKLLEDVIELSETLAGNPEWADLADRIRTELSHT